jgi:hypothetical protein
LAQVELALFTHLVRPLMAVIQSFRLLHQLAVVAVVMAQLARHLMPMGEMVVLAVVRLTMAQPILVQETLHQQARHRETMAAQATTAVLTMAVVAVAHLQLEQMALLEVRGALVQPTLFLALALHTLVVVAVRLTYLAPLALEVLVAEVMVVVQGVQVEQLPLVQQTLAVVVVALQS